MSHWCDAPSRILLQSRQKLSARSSSFCVHPKVSSERTEADKEYSMREEFVCLKTGRIARTYHPGIQMTGFSKNIWRPLSVGTSGTQKQFSELRAFFPMHQDPGRPNRPSCLEIPSILAACKKNPPEYQEEKPSMDPPRPATNPCSGCGASSCRTSGTGCGAVIATLFRDSKREVQPWSACRWHVKNACLNHLSGLLFRWLK